jgi:hypothetical protein
VALGVLFTVVSLVTGSGPASACTSAVVGPKASLTGTPILWKNRDTSRLSNKVVFINEEPFAYLCLANARADSGRSCYAGLNAAGFAIMNTVAYNVPKIAAERKDREGIVIPAAEPPPTPLERNGAARLTSYDELSIYLEQLAAASPVEQFGGVSNINIADEILETVGGARTALTAGHVEGSPIHIRQDYVSDPDRPTIDYPVFDLRTWTSRVAELGNFDSRVVPLLIVERPSANAADDTWR